jgi:hypothetical protein
MREVVGEEGADVDGNVDALGHGDCDWEDQTEVSNVVNFDSSPECGTTSTSVKPPTSLNSKPVSSRFGNLMNGWESSLANDGALGDVGL